MFTGLVEEMGECLWLRQNTAGIQLALTAKKIVAGLHSGDSVAINGCCLTVASHRKEQIAFDLLEETLARTNLGKLRPGSRINLERALPANGRLGGHFVQGHVDCTAKVLAIGDRGDDRKIEISLPHEFSHYVAWKGSVSINGVSLTVAELTNDSLAVWLIPHTRRKTNLGKLVVGDTINFEFDILAKYAERILSQSGKKFTEEQP